MTDSQRLELESLCNALVDESISRDEGARLESWIARDEEARQFYVRFLGLSAGLAHVAGDSQMEPAPAKVSLFRKPLFWLAGSSSVAAAVAVWLVFTPVEKTSVSPPASVAAEDDTDSVAMLAASENCAWKSTNAISPGTAFYAGQTLDLLSGFAEVVFDCGARVMLEGPATVQLTSAWEAGLRKGTLRATVPQEAVGFRVASPEVDIVDLGTEFSVVADDSGASEVFVHTGAVEVQPRVLKSAAKQDRKAILREREARRFAKNGGSEVRDVEKKWLALGRKVALSAAMKPSIFHQWNSANEGGEITVTGASAMKHLPLPRSGGWDFDGSYAAKLALPKFSQSSASTLAFWVRIPQDSPLGNAPPMLSWRQGKFQGLLEAGTNDDPAHGVVGALALRLGNRKLVGAKSLRDGAWHHVAIVILRQPREDGGRDLHAKCYVDGRLEPRSGRGTFKHAKVKGFPPMQPGLWIASGVDDDPDEYFQGAIDDLVLADGVMSQAEIRQWMAAKRDL